MSFHLHSTSEPTQPPPVPTTRPRPTTLPPTQIPTVPPTTKRPVVTSSEIIPPEKDYFGKSTQAENAKTPTRLSIETHSHVAFLHKLCLKFYPLLISF